LSTAMVLPDWLGRHLPLMNNWVFEYATRLAPLALLLPPDGGADDQAPI
jgi:hypothetical protein